MWVESVVPVTAVVLVVVGVLALAHAIQAACGVQSQDMILAINGTPARLINDQQMTTLFKSEPLIKMVVDRLGEAEGGEEEEDDDVFTEMTTGGGTSHVISVPYFGESTWKLIRCVREARLQLCGGWVLSLDGIVLVPSSNLIFLHQPVWRTSPLHFGCARALVALLVRPTCLWQAG
jgi:hypothetical protein